MKMVRSGHRAGWMNGLAAAVFACAGLVQAATLTWNGGVAGSWQAGGGGWLDGGGGAATWNSATPDDAVFGGLSAGSLTIDAGGVTVGDVAVTNGFYAIDPGGTLTLSNTVFFVDGTLTTRVGAALSGASGLVKDGTGTLLFTNANKNYSGATIISNGAIRILSTAVGVLGATATQSVVLAGGTLEAQFSGNLVPSNRITVTAAGGQLRNLGTDSQRWSIDGNRITGTGTLTLAFGSNNSRIQIVTGQTDFFGKWVVDSGGNQNRFIDLFASSAFGGAAGADAITLFNAGSLALRAGVILGSSTQGVQLAGPQQCKITVTGGSTGVLAGALSGSATNAIQFFLENSASVLVISNAANSWLGETTLNGSGVVRLGAAGVLPDAGGNVVVSSGTTLDLNGYDETLGGLFGGGRVDNRTAAGVVTLTVGSNNNSPTFSGILTNSGSGATLNLVKTGTGTQTLSGTNTVNGFVSVDGGTLALSSAADLAASTAVTVNAGATLLATGRSDGTFKVAAGQVLSGDGTVIGILTNEGVVAPGAPVGMLMQTGNFAQASSGTLRITIAGASTHDQLRSSGAATLGGTLDVVLDGYAPVANDAFNVVAFASRTGTFAMTNLPALSAGLGWVVQYLSTGVVAAVTGAPPVAGYDLWAGSITNGLTNYNESATLDGYPNLLKYATGSSPTNSDDLPRLTATVTGGVLSLRFNRNTNATDVVLVVQASERMADGAAWTGIATNSAGAWLTPGVTETGAGTPVQVVVPDGVAGASNRYLRLTVTRP
jgi:fibronectin-binding autotransporter adhesin